MLLTCIVSAYADIPANQTPETQGFNSYTMVQAVGLVTESDELIWQGSSYGLDDPPLSGPATATPWDDTGDSWEAFYHSLSGHSWGILVSKNFPQYPIAQGDVYFWDKDPSRRTAGEVQYVTSYNEDTIADSGVTSYTKSLIIDTRNKVANQENFEAKKLVDFLGSDTGAITSDESLLLDTAGQYGWGGDAFICPFAANQFDVTPQFCNIGEMGSRLTMNWMQLSTSASDRCIAAIADTPISMDYDIIVDGIGDAPALGDVAAYMNVHSMEGRMIPVFTLDFSGFEGTSYRPGLAQDNIYNEETNARGAIFHFQKDMSCTSGFRRIN